MNDKYEVEESTTTWYNSRKCTIGKLGMEQRKNSCRINYYR